MPALDLDHPFSADTITAAIQQGARTVAAIATTVNPTGILGAQHTRNVIAMVLIEMRNDGLVTLADGTDAEGWRVALI